MNSQTSWVQPGWDVLWEIWLWIIYHVVFVDDMSGFPCSMEIIDWKSFELWKQFSRPWKSIDFDQNVHKVLKKYGNSKCSHLFIQILLVSADNSSADFFALCYMNKLLNFRKTKVSDGIEVF